MLCLSGFELHSSWVPLFMADSETDKKKLFERWQLNLGLESSLPFAIDGTRLGARGFIRGAFRYGRQ